MNILVTTLGTTWTIVPELFGFTNPKDLDLYAHSSLAHDYAGAREEHGIQPVDEIWIVTTTNQNLVAPALEELKRWAFEFAESVRLRVYQRQGVCDLANVEECRQMSDLIYRCVLKAHNAAVDGQVLLSLAGGRKTMSADIQEAGHIFGCCAMLHVVDAGNLPDELRAASAETFYRPLKAEWADLLSPMVTSGKLSPMAILQVDPRIDANDYPLAEDQNPPGLDLFDVIKERQNNAGALLCNYATLMTAKPETTNFRALYSLPPEIIERLRRERIGLDPEKNTEELNWLRALPKAELHCHFGGILTPEEMIEVALANGNALSEAKKHNSPFNDWCRNLEEAVVRKNLKLLSFTLDGTGRKLPQRFPELTEPLAVCGYLAAFRNCPQMLHQIIYGDLMTDNAFTGIGIEAYEALGDLQGSQLMQSQESIDKACEIIKRHMAAENITHMELRCSPGKYTRGGRSAMDVLRQITRELADVKIIIIASRHGRMSEVYQHIELAQEFGVYQREKRAMKTVVGFDLAGAEHARSPAEMRDAFMPLLMDCMHMTVHAGETEDVSSIWQAIYYLQADRIGHALNLWKNKALFRHVVDRGIAVELCPSSNQQIVGFKERGVGRSKLYDYPLESYLGQGVRATINTDNPGISLTTLTKEYYQAALMTDSGLSKWQILQLVRNGFRAGFRPNDPLRPKSTVLLQAEKQIMQLIQKEYC